MQNGAVLNQEPVKILANPPEVEGEGGMEQFPHRASEQMPPSSTSWLHPNIGRHVSDVLGHQL